MAEISWQAKIELDISDLKQKLQQVDNELKNTVGTERKIELGIDTKKLEKTISNLDKMLDNLGKGSNDFKQFENLSKYLENVKSDLSDIKKTFGSLNTNGMNNIVASINSIDKSITSLTEKLQIVKKDASGNIINTSSIGELGNLFVKIEQHLDSLHKTFGEIGDSDGLKPLINQVNDLKTAMSGLKMNLNLDLGDISQGSDQKVAETTRRYAQAYKSLFEQIKSSKRATKEMLQFIEPDNVSDAELAGIYKSMIGRAETKYSTTSIKNGKKVTNNNFRDWFSEYYREIRNARDTVRNAKNVSANGLSLENIFGKTDVDLSGVVSQLELIANKLDEITSNAKTMGEAFSSGINVAASVEEITKLTDRVKELEVELQKVKSVNTGSGVSGNGNNNGSGGKSDNQKAVNKALQDQISAWSKIQNIREKIAKTDDSNLITKYQEQGKVFAEQYNTAGNILKANQNLYDSQVHINQLKTKQLETDTKIYQIQKNTEKSDISKQYKEAMDTIVKYESIQKELNKLNASGDYSSNSYNLLKSEAESLKPSFDNAKSVIEQFRKEAEKDYDTSSMKLIGKTAQEVADDVQRAEKAMHGGDESYNKLIDAQQQSITSAIANAEKFNTSLKKSGQNFFPSEEYNKIIKSTEENLKKLKDLQAEINKQGGIADADQMKKLTQYTDAIKENQEALKNLSASQKGSTPLKNEKAIERINKALEQNTRMSAEAKAQLKAYIEELKTNPAADIAKIEAAWRGVVRAEKEAGRGGKSLFSAVGEKMFYGLAGQIANMVSLWDVINVARQGIQTVVELDTALVDLQKTTTMSDSQLKDFYYDSNDVAKQMGVTTQEIIEQASAWSRLGYSSAEAATKMAQLSSQFSTISPGMDTESAQEGLVSIMKAWDINVDDVKSEIMDKVNILGNTMAESNQDIVEGMERSAAALAAVGTSTTDAFALFSGINEVLQNAEKSGTALRSVSLRLRSFDESTEEYSDDLKNITGELVDLTKTAEHTQGVSIFKDGSTTEFKSLTDYFREISNIWDEMTQKQQNDYLLKAFGRTQAQAGSALIQNFKGVDKALNEMTNSAGSADKEMETIKASLEYKLNALRETWVGTAQKMADRSVIGGVVDGLTAISTAIQKIGILPTAAIGGGIFAFFKESRSPE